MSESDEAPCPAKNESDDDGDGEGGPDKVEVANVPDAVNEEVLKAFFEGPKSGGCAGAVANVVRIKPGVFHVTFCDSKGEIWSQNASSISDQGPPLVLFPSTFYIAKRIAYSQIYWRE